jgi:MipA family protein
MKLWCQFPTIGSLHCPGTAATKSLWPSSNLGRPRVSIPYQGVFVKVHEKLLRFTALALIGSAVYTTACAQMFDAVRLGPAPAKDGGTFGLAAIAGHEYQGSDERRYLLVPVLDYRWTNGWFAGVTNGIGFNFSSRSDIRYGLRATVDLGRNENRSPALTGMGDVGVRPEFGGFLNYAVAPTFVLASSLRYGSAGGDGLLLDLGAVQSFSLAPQWRLAIGAAATYANSRYIQTYFGVDFPQSARSGYPVYTPDAGTRDARVSVSLNYRLNPRVFVTGAMSVSSLLGDAKSSPLVRERSSANAVVAVGYAF